MKKIFLIFLLVGATLNSFSQKKQSEEGPTLDDFGRIGFFTDIVTNDPDFDGRALDKVKKGLERMLLKESMGKSVDDRFGLVAVPIIYSKEKTSTTPPKYFYEFGVDIIAVDYKEKTKYGVYTYDGLTGMNANSQRALMSGLKGFKTNRGFTEFVREMKQKIIDYYESNCDFILTDAETNASNDEFDNALSILSGVPTVCKECYDRAQEKSREVYMQKLERECQALVAEATSLIAAEEWVGAAGVLKKVLPGISCHAEAVALIQKVETHWCGVNLGKAKGFQQAKDFNQAAQFLALVPTTSACADDADALGKKIYGELTAKEQQDWEFKMKKYNDEMSIEQRNFDFSVNKFERGANRQDRSMDLEDKRLNRSLDLEGKAMDYALETTKIIQSSLIEVQKAKSNKTVTENKNWSFLGLEF